MLRKKSGSIEWLEFELLQECKRLRHRIYTRKGGVSTGPFASLNLSLSSGDDSKAVAANRSLIAETPLVVPHQVHGKRLEVVSSQRPSLPPCDGLITDMPAISLLSTHADCQIGVIYDPTLHVVATVHSGWRGSVLNIYSETVDKLMGVYGCKAGNILVGIGPSLGPNSAEFIHYQKELPEHFWDYQVRPTYFNFWEISRMQLEKCGVLPHHIEIAGIDTHTQEEDFFSYRREKRSGRNGTVVELL